ncbi:hypothetical protein Tco_0307505, partial [Tanacetum coccineum]
RVAKLEKDVSKHKNINLSAEALATLKSQVLNVVDDYLGSKLGDALQKTLHKHSADLIQKHSGKPAFEKHDDDDDDDDEDPLARPNQVKKTKRSRTKESESSKKPSTTKETPKGKAPSKGSKISKSASAKEPVEEPILEVVMDDAGKDMPWFNKMVSTIKDPLTFIDLMATPIDFSKFELEYHFQECFNALTDMLDWNNIEGDRYPFDMSKPLPLQGHPGHLTVVADYFFNNDLEYLKSSDLERTYSTLIMKTKAARYEIERIEDMVPTL